MSTKFPYARLARTAQRLIDRFGIVEDVTGYFDVPNPEVPNRPGGRTTFHLNAPAVFLNIEEKLVDGDLIKLGDMKVLIAALSVAIPPKLKGTISRTVDGESETWSIQTIKPLNPGGVKLIYTLLVRRS